MVLLLQRKQKSWRCDGHGDDYRLFAFAQAVYIYATRRHHCLLALGGVFINKRLYFSAVCSCICRCLGSVKSGVAAAFYTLYAVPLIKKYSSLVIVGWSMVIGGSVMSFIHPPWEASSLSPITCGYILFVIIFGTMLAFWFYVESLQSLLPKETSLLGSLEPLAAVITTVV